MNVAAIPWLPKTYDNLEADQLLIRGAAPKSLVVIPRYRPNTDGPFDDAWVAKCPGKRGPKECVTEYLISCIGRRLPLRVAQGRLVRMQPPTGIECDVRFLSRYFLPRKNDALMHGLEVVARCFDMEEGELRVDVPIDREREFFTIDLLTDVLREVAGSEGEFASLLGGFGRMMAFDALIGANDRHPENWGLTYNVLEPERFRFSPVYDTARGLFWNASDEQLAGWDTSGRRVAEVERYAERSKPLVSAEVESQSSRKNLNHFEVINYMMRPSEPRYAASIRRVIAAFRPDDCEKMLHRQFHRLLSRRRLEYIDAVLRYRHRRLKNICRLP